MSGKLELATRLGQPVLPLTPASWFEATCGGPGPKLVWLCMCYLGRPRGGQVGGACWAAVSTIARLAECHVGTVRRHLRTLQNGGRIEAEAVSRGRKPTHYRLAGGAVQPEQNAWVQPEQNARVQPEQNARVQPEQSARAGTYVDATASKPPARGAREGDVARRGRALSPRPAAPRAGRSDAPQLWSESLEIPAHRPEKAGRKRPQFSAPGGAAVPGFEATQALLDRNRQLRRQLRNPEG